MFPARPELAFRLTEGAIRSAVSSVICAWHSTWHSRSTSALCRLCERQAERQHVLERKKAAARTPGEREELAVLRRNEACLKSLRGFDEAAEADTRLTLALGGGLEGPLLTYL